MFTWQGLQTVQALGQSQSISCKTSLCLRHRRLQRGCLEQLSRQHHERSSRQCKGRAGGGLWLHTCDNGGMSEIESMVGQSHVAISLLLSSPGVPQIRQLRKASSFTIRLTMRSSHRRRRRMPSKRLLWTLVSPHTSPVHGNSMSSHLSCPGPPLKLATCCIRC